MRPVLFIIPWLDMPLYSYGVFLGVAFISGWYLTYSYTNREGLPYKSVTYALALIVIFSMAGAHVAHVLSNTSWEGIQFQKFIQELLTPRREGLVAYGGFMGGTMALVFYAWVRKFSAWSFLDCATPGLALGLGLTRIGCFLAGCCHGRPTEYPLGMVFPYGSHAARVFPDPAAPAMHPYSLPVHPTQLYESALGLFILLPLAIRLMPNRRATGQNFLTFMALYAIGRFCLEWIRGDDDRGTVFGIFSTSQFIGICILPVVLGILIYRLKTGPAPPTPLSKEEVKRSLIRQGLRTATKDDGQ
jgi:phosphatidylglycerol:prolipoprotein diacylglycerol transferase